MAEQDFSSIWAMAREAGLDAGNNHVPQPMHIRGYEPIADGMCGFAYVRFPGNNAFGRWAKRNGYAKPDSYYGGLYYSVREHNQSYEKKGKHARAFAKVLTENGIARVTVETRLD